MTEESPLMEQQRLLAAIADELVREVGAGVPMRFVARALASTSEYELLDLRSDPPIPMTSLWDATDLVGELRAAMYVAGAGTWFTMNLEVDGSGAVDASFDYNNEPTWWVPVDPVAYATDLDRYVRETPAQPAWLRKRLAEAEERHSAQFRNEAQARHEDSAVLARVAAAGGYVSISGGDEAETVWAGQDGVEVSVVFADGRWSVLTRDRGHQRVLGRFQSQADAGRLFALRMVNSARTNAGRPAIYVDGFCPGSHWSEQADWSILAWPGGHAEFAPGISGRNAGRAFSWVALTSLHDIADMLHLPDAR